MCLPRKQPNLHGQLLAAKSSLPFLNHPPGLQAPRPPAPGSAPCKTAPWCGRGWRCAGSPTPCGASGVAVAPCWVLDVQFSRCRSCCFYSQCGATAGWQRQQKQHAAVIPAHKMPSKSHAAAFINPAITIPTALNPVPSLHSQPHPSLQPQHSPLQLSC